MMYLEKICKNMGGPGHPQKEDTQRVESFQSENTKVNHEKVCGGPTGEGAGSAVG